jgi:hypothetical protein
MICAGMDWGKWGQLVAGNIIQGSGWGELTQKTKGMLCTKRQCCDNIVVQVVKLSECEIYSYDPDSDADPSLEKGAM